MQSPVDRGKTRAIAAEEERKRAKRERERLVTEFWFRIPGHRAEFRMLSRSFFRAICLVDTDSPTAHPGCFLFQAAPMQFHRVSRVSTTPDWDEERRQNDLVALLVPWQNRYPIKIAAKADAESLLLSPWREIDFSLLRGRLNGKGGKSAVNVGGECATNVIEFSLELAVQQL